MSEVGFTYDPVRGRAPRAGYALAIHPERGWVIEAARFRAEHLRRFLAAHLELLRADPALHAGGWLDHRRGLVHLDLAVVEPAPARALRLARRHGQLGVFDLAAGRTIPTGREPIPR